MGLIVRVPRRLRRSLVLFFSDELDQIVIGRDPARCRILFARGVRAVGLEHCALRRVLGRYRLVLNADDPVFVDGEQAYDGDELPERCEIRLGARGPRLRLECTHRDDLPPAKRHVEALGRRGRPKVLLSALRLQRIVLSLLAAVALPVVALLAAFGVFGGDDSVALPLDHEAALSEVLEHASRSVYRVIVIAPDGGATSGATAWVVAPDTLATNAHVGEAIEKSAHRATYHVRSCEAEPRTFRVTNVMMHPGYEALHAMWSAYRPAEGRNRGRRHLVRTAGRYYDVALLHVEEGSDLGPPLPIASAEVLRALRPGEPVGYVGYPAESICLGESPVERPTPHRHTGRITSVTDFFGAPAAFEANLLLHHDCPGTGGSSGSPVLNLQGEVVGLMSAGNFAFSRFGRTPTGAGINYAQRADLLHELLEGRADATLERRQKEWEARLSELYECSHRLDCASWIEGILRDISRRHTTNSSPTEHLVWEDIETRRERVDPKAGSPSTSPTLRLPLPGRYVVLLYPRVDHAFAADCEFKADGEVSWSTCEVKRGGSSLHYCEIDADHPGTLRYALHPRKHGVEVDVQLLRAGVQELTPQSILQSARKDWRRYLRRQTYGPYGWEIEIVHQETYTLFDVGPAHASHVARFTPEKEGGWMILAIAREPRRIQLEIEAFSAQDLTDEGRSPSVRIHVDEHEVDRTRKIVIKDASPQTGSVGVDLYVLYARRLGRSSAD